MARLAHGQLDACTLHQRRSIYERMEIPCSSRSSRFRQPVLCSHHCQQSIRSTSRHQQGTSRLPHRFGSFYDWECWGPRRRFCQNRGDHFRCFRWYGPDLGNYWDMAPDPLPPQDARCCRGDTKPHGGASGNAGYIARVFLWASTIFIISRCTCTATRTPG